MRRTIIRGAMITMAMLVGSISARAASTIIVSASADGSLIYYNSNNGAEGTVNQDGVVWDGGPAGDTIGLCAYGTAVYTFGIVTNGANTGQYRVNKIDLSGLAFDVSGNDIVASNPANRNILTTSASTNLVDIAYDGTTFYFLAADGKVYTDSSTTALVDFGTFTAFVYKTISLWGGAANGLAVACTGNTTSGRVLTWDGTTIAQYDTYEDALALGVTLASGRSDTNVVSWVRVDNLAYNGNQNDPGTYVGNFGYREAPVWAIAQGFRAGARGAYVVPNAGNLTFQASTVGSGNYSNTLGIAAADIVDAPPTPFPSLGNITGANLIPNGDLGTLANESPATPGIWNVAGTFGDHESATNRTADLLNWSPYYEDPNALIPAVGTPHVIDGNGELDGTFYLDTHINGSVLTLNSVMGYRNGMKQENILNGVTIDPAASYEFSIDVARPGINAIPNATFRAALTVGTGADVTNTATAVTGSLLEINVNTIGSNPQRLTINGSDLVAAQSGGAVNVILDQVNATAIPGFPGSTGGTNSLEIALVKQVSVNTASLAQILTARMGDVTRDGFVFQDDVDLANSYLDGTVDLGDSAFDRQTILIADGMSSNAALAQLNLVDFDLTGNGFFDAADVAEIEALLEGPPLQVSGNGSNLDFQWLGKASKRYDLLATASLTIPAWTVYNDGLTTYGNIAGVPTNVLTGVVANGSVNFFQLLEKPSGTSFITVLDPSFENGDTSGNWGPVNALWNPTQANPYQVNNGDNMIAEDGAWSLLLDNATSISQDLGTSVNSGDTLTLIFSAGRGLAASSTAPGGTLNATIVVGGTDYTIPVDTTILPNPADWQSYTNEVTISNSGALSIRFDATGGFAWLDNVREIKRVEP